MLKRMLVHMSLAIVATALLAEPATSADEAKAVFSRLDTNGDGVILHTEFDIKSFEIFYIRDRNENIKIEPGEVRLSAEAFAAADSDRDGHLSGVEFFDAPFAQFEAADANTDQMITQQEFERFISQFVVD